MRSGKIIIAVLLAFPFLYTSESAGQTLHVIAVADTDSNIGPSVRVDLSRLKSTLKNGFEGNQLHWIELSGGNANPGTVIKTLKEVVIDPQRDAVMLYYSGHGGFDAKRGHFLSMSHGGRLYRSQVLNAITTPVTPKFWVVVTDCCANLSDAAFNSPSVAAPQRRKILLQNLFFQTQGSVDITSSRPGQFSYCSPSLGGAFTIAFCGVIEDNYYNNLRWDDVFRQTRSQTARLTELMIEGSKPVAAGGAGQQTTQTAYSFSEMYGQDVNAD